MADERSQAERWVSFAAGIVTPMTVIGALLFYFGYVSARSQYEYFGIDVDTIGLSTQDYVMRSPQPLLVPLLVLTLLAVAGVVLHAYFLRTQRITETTVRRARYTALAFLLVGVVALFAYPLLGDLPYYALGDPVVIGLAAAALAYLSYLASKLAETGCSAGRPRTPRLRPRSKPLPAAGDRHRDARHRHHHLCVLGHGHHRAVLRARAGQVGRDAPGPVPRGYPGHEGAPPAPLARRGGDHAPAGCGTDVQLPVPGLRLLVVGQNRSFLVPQKWSASNTTLVVPLDSSIRVRFQFQNDPP